MHPDISKRSAGPSDNAAGLLHRHPSGLLLARDLAELGEDPRTARRAAGRNLAKVRPGAYVDAGAWANARQLEQHRLVVLATVAGMRTQPIVSHESAAALLGIPLVGPLPNQVQVTDRTSAGGRSSTWIRRHGVASLPDAVLVDGIAVTSPARTVIDLARTRSLTSGLAAADFVLRTGAATMDDLHAALEEVRGRRGYRRALSVVEKADSRSESVGESVSRAQMYLLGVPIPHLQREFFDERGLIGRSDFWWEDVDVVGEFDGRVKYLPTGHAAGTPPEEVVWVEKRREDRLRRRCRGVVRWVWDEALNIRIFGRLLAQVGILPLRRGGRR